MADRDYGDGGFLEPFFLLAAILWIGGALLFVSVAAMGTARTGNAPPAATQAPAAEATQTP